MSYGSNSGQPSNTPGLSSLPGSTTGKPGMGQTTGQPTGTTQITGGFGNTLTQPNAMTTPTQNKPTQFTGKPGQAGLSGQTPTQDPNAALGHGPMDGQTLAQFGQTGPGGQVNSEDEGTLDPVAPGALGA